MNTLYLECNMGAAGDMLMAALYELLPEKEAFLEQMNHLGLEGVRTAAEPSVKCGITGTHISVTVDGEEEESRDEHDHVHSHEHDHVHSHEHDHVHSHDDDHVHNHEHNHGHAHEHNHGHSHHHAGMHDIEHIVSHLNVPDKVRRDVLAVYRLIAGAESHAHGRPIDQIHFHEVGTLDAVADIAGVCLLMDKLAVDRVVVSPIHVGCGQVRCAHGILPVPAPATAHILMGVPTYGGVVKGELCTPTGAALLKYFADEFGGMPVMRVTAVGYGMGKKDFEAANCVRAMLGESEENRMDGILELSCNLDDMTPEALGFAQERLWEAGALDVFTTAIGMKKNRPAAMLTCLCRPEDRMAIVSCLFRHTTTLGIREQRCVRYTLTRKNSSVDTAYGTVAVKEASGYGVSRKKAEYEDLAKICREQHISLAELTEAIGR